MYGSRQIITAIEESRHPKWSAKARTGGERVARRYGYPMPRAHPKFRPGTAESRSRIHIRAFSYRYLERCQRSTTAVCHVDAEHWR
jgi:hypothetical protein